MAALRLGASRITISVVAEGKGLACKSSSIRRSDWIEAGGDRRMEDWGNALDFEESIQRRSRIREVPAPPHSATLVVTTWHSTTAAAFDNSSRLLRQIVPIPPGLPALFHAALHHPDPHFHKEGTSIRNSRLWLDERPRRRCCRANAKERGRERRGLRWFVIESQSIR